MFNELNAMPLNSNFKLFKIMQISAAWLAISALAHCKFKFNVRRRNKIENKWNRVQAPPTRTLGNNGHTPCQSIFIGSDIVFCVCVCVLLPSLPFLFILFCFFCCPLGGRIYGRHRNQSHFPFSFHFGIGWHRLPPPSWSILNCNAIRQTAASQMTANHRYTPSALTLISIISIHMQICRTST